MKKNILTATSFVVILVALLLGVSEVFSIFNYHSTTLASEPENTMDYLVIGDSEAYVSISPTLIYNNFGYTGYNLGKARMNLQETYYSLIEGIKNQSPKYVFMEVDAAYREGKPFKNFETLFFYGMESFFSITSYHNDWKKIIDNNFKINEATAEELSTTNYLKGFQFHKEKKPYKGNYYMDETDEFVEILEYHDQYLQKMIDTCKEEGITIVLYSSISPVNWNYKKHNTIQRIADENNVEYIDFNLKIKELDFDYTNLTYDGGDHVNYDGAKIITNYIGSYLKKENELIDKRMVDEYQYWDVTKKKYLEVVGE